MATQFRDTTFGHIVRFASNNRLLKYPDEIDPTLWKKSLQGQDASSSETANGSSVEKASNSRGDALDGTNLGSSDPAHIPEGGRDIYLVDWYGPDDPEVSTFRTS